MFGFLFRLIWGSQHVDVASVSEKGAVRSDNQDACFVDKTKTILCVADGMGGGQGGSIASRIVCEEVAKAEHAREFKVRIEAVADAFQRANVDIRRQAEQFGYKEMGTTVAVMLFDPTTNQEVAIGHVGDTRVYRRRKCKLERMTQDHRKSPLSHFLTRAIGVAPSVEADWLHASVRKGDVWLICCDGVHDMLPDSTINGILAQGGDAKEMADRLGKAVCRAGARDNYTLIVAKI